MVGLLQRIKLARGRTSPPAPKLEAPTAFASWGGRSGDEASYGPELMRQGRPDIVASPRPTPAVPGIGYESPLPAVHPTPFLTLDVNPSGVRQLDNVGDLDQALADLVTVYPDHRTLIPPAWAGPGYTNYQAGDDVGSGDDGTDT